METSLLWKYLNLQTTEKETKAVQKWLSNDPDGSHAEILSDMHCIFDGVALHLDQDHVNATQSYPKRRSWSYVFAAVTSIAVIVSVFFANAYYKIAEHSNRMEAISVPSGKTMQLTLEDGTVLWMNSGTRIERPTLFASKDRTIILREGEVMLDVAKDQSRPFHVLTPSSDIKVLGTKFDVSLDEGTCTTTLIRGSVQITSDAGESVTLHPYEVAVQNPDGILSVSSINNSDSVECWTQGVINLVGHSFEELMKMFEKSFDITIVVAREKMPQIKLARGKVRVIDGVEHALDVLSIGADFSYKVDYSNNLITIN